MQKHPESPQDTPHPHPHPQSHSPPAELDLSSIQPQPQSQSRSNSNDSSLIIEEVGGGCSADEEEFRSNVRELLLTDGDKVGGGEMGQRVGGGMGVAEGMGTGEGREGGDCGQFEGEPFKGSFLRDMDVLGKTVSFQTAYYNIYEDFTEKQQSILSQLNNQNNKQQSQIDIKFIKDYRNLSKMQADMQPSYIVDFAIKINKKGKSNSKFNCKCKCKCQNKINKIVSQKHILSDLPDSSKSIKNKKKGKSNSRPQSQKKLKQQKSKSSRKFNKINQQSIRRSNLSYFTGQSIGYGVGVNYPNLKKGKSSPLKKVPFKSILSQAIKTKQSEASFNLDKQKKKKKNQQKIDMRNKL